MVWLSSGMYALTYCVLVACYVNAIPFFRNTLAGDLFYTGVLFGAYFAVLHLAGARNIAAGNEASAG